MEELHPKDLNIGARFRDSIRGGKLTTEHLNRGQRILNAALEKHGDQTLTKENFHKVIEHMHRDQKWGNMYSAGPEFENVLKEHLGVREQDHASITSPSSSETTSEGSMSDKKEEGSER